ncbi:hypothetical protein BOTCAL_0021g00370 [Botryotinia calthae]|uniref:Uncharacterized protein n=1 Tax=Botryotinia calthae TaxID=38488 RepID=A0A4Y8DEN9_9HELO|nr:hypothetical protein BOTCAL_0021g00370 [Botryotinia calthae]
MHGLEVLVALCRSSAFYRADLNSSNAGTRPISGGIRLCSSSENPYTVNFTLSLTFVWLGALGMIIHPKKLLQISSRVPDDVAVPVAVAVAVAVAVLSCNRVRNVNMADAVYLGPR